MAHCENPPVESIDEIVFSMTKSEIDISNSTYNRSHWANIKDLFEKFISLGCIIFGGAPRDKVCRDYWVSKFEEYTSSLPETHKYNRSSFIYYDDPTFHPTSYNNGKGRTLLPKDFDLFIKGKTAFAKVKDYLFETFNIAELQLDDKADAHCPYFLESNEKLKKVLTYHRFTIKGYKINLGIKRLLKSIPDKFLNRILSNYENENTMNFKIDIIVLADDWVKICDSELEYKDVSPPFGCPDFRCNQLYFEKVKHPIHYSDGNYDDIGNWAPGMHYTMKANLQVIEKTTIELFDHGLGCRTLAYKVFEMKKLQNEIDNIQCIIDDIITQKAVAVKQYRINNTTQFILPHRISKMILKGYTIDLTPILPRLNEIPLTLEDKCIICYDNIKSKSIMRFCNGENCHSIMHIDCWAEYIENMFRNGVSRYQITCPLCRKSNPICIDEERHKQSCVKTCVLVNTLRSANHYSNLEMIRRNIQYIPFNCMVCITYERNQNLNDDLFEEDIPIPVANLLPPPPPIAAIAPIAPIAAINLEGNVPIIEERIVIGNAESENEIETESENE
jgi:hypothetical protein